MGSDSEFRVRLARSMHFAVGVKEEFQVDAYLFGLVVCRYMVDVEGDFGESRVWVNVSLLTMGRSFGDGVGVV